jgi:uncharacterized protein YjbI with pentapeptide repeats
MHSSTVMARVLCLSAILLGAWMQLSSDVAASNPLSVGSKYQILVSSETDTPACYIQTEDGKILDLRNLCGQPTRNTTKTTAQTADIKRLLATNQCPGCNLSGANLANANLRFANLVSANLSGANLSGASLIGANLNDANLTGADLKSAKLNGARMMRTNLNGARLVEANLLGANLIGASLNGAKLHSANMPDGNLHN